MIAFPLVICGKAEYSASPNARQPCLRRGDGDAARQVGPPKTLAERGGNGAPWLLREPQLRDAASAEALRAMIDRLTDRRG
jgi:hypothetical protein